MEKIYGVVQKLIYYDENQGFGIIHIKLDYQNPDLMQYREKLFSNIVTVLSNFDRRPIIDEEYYFTGDFETSSYGLQFRAKTFQRLEPQNEEGIITYLSSDFFPGVGIKTAQKVYRALGSNCLQKIINDYNVLNDVDITEKQKRVIYENLLTQEKNEKELINLLNLGITLRMAIKIQKHLGINAYEIVKNNPYKLIDLIDGIGFNRADQIAINNGITRDNPFRLKALIIYVLRTYLFDTGNTYLGINELFSEALKYESDFLTKDIYLDLVQELHEEKKLVIENNFIYDYKLYLDEYKIAERIHLFLQSQSSEFENIDVCLQKVMEANRITYSEKQIEAIKKAILEPIVIITGGPGTGKSTIIKGIIDTYSSLLKVGDIIKEKIKLVAPTGRASKRLNEVTKHPATTIHKLLGYGGGDYFSVTPDTPIDAEMIIIDEFSMVDCSLARYLFSVILPDTKIVIVGDADQLPSVGPGNVLKDLIDSKEITTIHLDKIHRQASGSSIISLAHHINNGMVPEDLLKLKQDRSFIRCDNSLIIPQIEKTISRAIQQGMDLIKDIQVLVPLYKGDIGIDAINNFLQERFNPQDDEIVFRGKKFRINDKVIQLVNRSEKQVMNGDIGFVLGIYKNGDKFIKMTVMFDFGSVDYEYDELEELNLAYAISIHKSQGSEFPLVIMPLSFKYFIMLKRKLIYTGVTRAKKYLILIGDYQAMRKGIVEMEENRQTQLTQRIKEVFEKSNENDFENDIDDMENISPYDFM
ncbi:MAG TPA: ATP-dependent RecD-like DNA helicase [Acholeplasmataceae bacterium]|nr:ATP-dependent RecD-like DNA helicase [Acholeplasmataceae bacterium]